MLHTRVISFFVKECIKSSNKSWEKPFTLLGNPKNFKNKTENVNTKGSFNAKQELGIKVAMRSV